MSIPTTTLDAIRGLQKHVGEGNRARGFREDEELLDQQADAIEHAIEIAGGNDEDSITFSVEFVIGLLGTLNRSRVHAQANRMMLIVSEATEAHDETRSGRGVNETYYLYEDGSEALPRGNRPASIDPFDKPRKPEGVPSEIADIFIRCLDFADMYGIDLADIIAEKDAYNATRPYKHGRRF